MSRKISKEYKIIKNLIHNDLKVTKSDILDIIKDSIDGILKDRLETSISTAVDRVFEWKGQSMIRSELEQRLNRIYGDSVNTRVHLENQGFINKLIIDEVNKRTDKLLLNIINEETIFNILKEKFKKSK